MSAELVAKRNVVKTITSEWKYSIGASDQKATASGSYKDNFEGWTDRCPLLGSEHPDIPNMILINIDASREDGDVIKIDLKYESNQLAMPGRPGGSETIKRYAVELSNGEEHILTHTRYEDLDEIERTALFNISNGTETGENGAYANAIKSDLGLECLAKIKKGNVARKNAGVIWVEKFITEDLSDINFPNFNKTELPPGGVGGAAENWLYIGTGAIEEAAGEIYSIEKRWEYKADEWDEDLYPAAD
jgi:hypothetical protein